MNETELEAMKSAILAETGAVDYRPVTMSIMAKNMKIQKRQLPTFKEAIATLIEDGRMRQDKQGRMRIRGSVGLVSGILRKISSGAAFVIPSARDGQASQGDIYISARDVRDAQTGDEVMVRLSAKRRSNGQRCGTIEKIVERATSIFVGTYFESGDQGFVRIDGTAFNSPVHVGDPGAKGAQPDDKVVIEMLRFPAESRSGQAVLTEVLGKRGDPGVDTLTVIHSMGLPHEFSADVQAEARTQADSFSDQVPEDRKDLTGELIITIDPIDARDFDDAISLKKSDDGHWQLGVHIADVAHFVPEGGLLDREARKRGTSVYLPRHVIPMLPELISNGLASLQQDQVRYTKSVFIEFDSSGSVVGADVANTAIRVARRFAYEEVMPIIRNPRQQAAGVTAPIRQLLGHMFELAMILRKRRFDQGALQMGIPEVEIDFDRQGAVTGAHERHHDESHEIIEEFMLAANIAVARMLDSRRVPFLRRIHGDPDALKMNNFQQFCQGLGLALQKPQSRHELQSLIRGLAGKPEERAVNYALLRSMRQAEYSPEEMGHYALAEEEYCHFTSPIRRYPDLTIHRLVDQLAKKGSVRGGDTDSLFELGKHCSFTERRAERAERELIRIKMLRYMSSRIGEEMDAFITGVESFGMFCQGIQIPAEGMLHLSALSDDFYVFDPTTRTLTGSRTRREFRLGDPIRVVVAAVDIDRRQLELRLAEKQTTIKRSRSEKPKGRDHGRDDGSDRGRGKSRRRDSQPSGHGFPKRNGHGKSSQQKKGKRKKKR